MSGSLGGPGGSGKPGGFRALTTSKMMQKRSGGKISQAILSGLPWRDDIAGEKSFPRVLLLMSFLGVTHVMPSSKGLTILEKDRTIARHDSRYILKQSMATLIRSERRHIALPPQGQKDFPVSD